jgi:hypothetical protein
LPSRGNPPSKRRGIRTGLPVFRDLKAPTKKTKRKVTKRKNKKRASLACPHYTTYSTPPLSEGGRQAGRKEFYELRF